MTDSGDANEQNANKKFFPWSWPSIMAMLISSLLVGLMLFLASHQLDIGIRNAVDSLLQSDILKTHAEDIRSAVAAQQQYALDLFIAINSIVVTIAVAVAVEKQSSYRNLLGLAALLEWSSYISLLASSFLLPGLIEKVGFLPAVSLLALVGVMDLLFAAFARLESRIRTQYEKNASAYNEINKTPKDTSNPHPTGERTQKVGWGVGGWRYLCLIGLPMVVFLFPVVKKYWDTLSRLIATPQDEISIIVSIVYLMTVLGVMQFFIISAIVAFTVALKKTSSLSEILLWTFYASTMALTAGYIFYNLTLFLCFIISLALDVVVLILIRNTGFFNKLTIRHLQKLKESLERRQYQLEKDNPDFNLRNTSTPWSGTISRTAHNDAALSPQASSSTENVRDIEETQSDENTTTGVAETDISSHSPYEAPRGLLKDGAHPRHRLVVLSLLMCAAGVLFAVARRYSSRSNH
jgi:hypothetical protein